MRNAIEWIFSFVMGTVGIVAGAFAMLVLFVVTHYVRDLLSGTFLASQAAVTALAVAFLLFAVAIATLLAHGFLFDGGRMPW